MAITTGFTTKLCTNQKELDESMSIRMKVFVEEQQFTIEEELDEKDPTSDHFLLLHSRTTEDEMKVVGTIRWYPRLNKLGRLAVLKEYRGGGAGAILVKCLEDHLRKREGKSGIANEGLKECLIVANAQIYAIGFYEKQGYITEGEQFIEDGDPHIRMVKTIQLE